MRFHVVSLPHTQTTKEFGACAFTQKVRKFCRMMKDQGHEVILYGGVENEAPCDEFITCITKERAVKSWKGGHYVNASFDPTDDHWRHFNEKVIKNMRERLQKRDFICLIGGYAQKVIADSFPHHMSVEIGIGYGGTFAKFRVFESYNWMHTVYANDCAGDTPNGNYYDAVIPNYFETEDFPLVEKRGDEKGEFYLFIGRMVHRKGVSVASEVCKTLGKRLILAGPGDRAEVEKMGHEYVGEVDAKKRGELMSQATAVFVPTIYIEPFGGVAVEAMLCGTPIITSDWGAFVEYNKPGKTGYRCRTKGEFMEATELVKNLNPLEIRTYAQEHFSLKRVGMQYEAYFQQLLSLWDKGWGTDWSGLKLRRYNEF